MDIFCTLARNAVTIFPNQDEFLMLPGQISFQARSLPKLALPLFQDKTGIGPTKTKGIAHGVLAGNFF